MKKTYFPPTVQLHGDIKDGNQFIGVHPTGLATLRTLIPENYVGMPPAPEIKSVFGIPVLIDESVLPDQLEVVANDGTVTMFTITQRSNESI